MIEKPRAREVEYGAAIGRTFRITDNIGTYHVRKGWKQSKAFPLEKDWRDLIRIGDVLRRGTHGVRVVRNALYKEDGILVSVHFTIRHCSWTGRCYTVLGRSDIRTFGYRPAGVRLRLGSDLDKEIFENLRTRDKTLDCCDVRGIA